MDSKRHFETGYLVSLQSDECAHLPYSYYYRHEDSTLMSYAYFVLIRKESVL